MANKHNPRTTNALICTYIEINLIAIPLALVSYCLYKNSDYLNLLDKAVRIIINSCKLGLNFLVVTLEGGRKPERLSQEEVAQLLHSASMHAIQIW